MQSAAAHIGDQDASVAYIAATPTTRINETYMQRQYDSMAIGKPPEDYIGSGVDESKLAGFQGFAGKEDISRELMGY